MQFFFYVPARCKESKFCNILAFIHGYTFSKLVFCDVKFICVISTTSTITVEGSYGIVFLFLHLWWGGVRRYRYNLLCKSTDHSSRAVVAACSKLNNISFINCTTCPEILISSCDKKVAVYFLVVDQYFLKCFLNFWFLLIIPDK